MEKFKRAVKEFVREDADNTIVSISLKSLRCLDYIVGKTTGVCPEPMRAAAMREVGDIMHEEAAKKPLDVIKPDMSKISLDANTQELKQQFDRGAQVVLLLEIKERLTKTDVMGWKKDAREELIAAIDKVL
jgi:hypothetical protein